MMRLAQYHSNSGRSWATYLAQPHYACAYASPSGFSNMSEATDSDSASDTKLLETSCESTIAGPAIDM
eukprot:9463087-Prorocentrum_lima.AAC.1